MSLPQKWINRTICEALAAPVVGVQTRHKEELQCLICGQKFALEKSRFSNVVRHMVTQHSAASARVDHREQEYFNSIEEKNERNRKRKNKQQNLKYAEEKEEFEQVKKVKKQNRFWENMEQFYL